MIVQKVLSILVLGKLLDVVYMFGCMGASA